MIWILQSDWLIRLEYNHKYCEYYWQSLLIWTVLWIFKEHKFIQNVRCYIYFETCACVAKSADCYCLQKICMPGKIHLSQYNIFKLLYLVLLQRLYSVTVIFYYIFHIKPHLFKTLLQSRLLFDFDDFFTNKGRIKCSFYTVILAYFYNL